MTLKVIYSIARAFTLAERAKKLQTQVKRRNFMNVHFPDCSLTIQGYLGIPLNTDNVYLCVSTESFKLSIKRGNL